MTIGAFASVVAETTEVYDELPAALYAFTRYQYCVAEVRPVSLYETALAEVVAIFVHGPLALTVLRSTLNPVSFDELSVHATSICDVEIVVALGASVGGRPHHRIGDRYQDLKEFGSTDAV